MFLAASAYASSASSYGFDSCMSREDGVFFCSSTGVLVCVHKLARCARRRANAWTLPKPIGPSLSKPRQKPTPTVRAELVEAGDLIELFAFSGGGGRGVRPAAQWLSFASPKESHQRKGAPAVRDPDAGAPGQPAMLGQAVRRRTRCALRAPLKQLRRVSARGGGVLRHPHAPPALRFSAPTKGNPRETNIHTGRRCARPRLASASASRRASSAERSKGPCGCWLSGPQPPAGCACGGAVAGWHARRSARASWSDSPWLSERRAKRKVSSTAHPATAPTQVAPQQSEGVADWGSPFLWSLSFGEAKESDSHAGRLPASALNTSMLFQPARHGFDKLSPNG